MSYESTPKTTGTGSASSLRKELDPENGESFRPDLLERIETPIAGISLGLAATLVMIGVVLRYAFGYSHPAFDEITRYAVIWGAFIASSRLLRHHGHITIDVLLVRLPERWQAVLRSVAFAAGAIFCVLLVFYGLKLVEQSFVLDARSQSSLRVPMWLPQLAVPVGGMLLFIRFIQHLLAHLRLLHALFTGTLPHDKSGRS